MMLLAYGCLVLGIPILCGSVCLALDGIFWWQGWKGHILDVISITLLGVFVFIVLKCAPKRRFMHLALGVILVPILLVITLMICGAILISPAALDGIR